LTYDHVQEAPNLKPEMIAPSTAPTEFISEDKNDLIVHMLKLSGMINPLKTGTSSSQIESGFSKVLDGLTLNQTLTTQSLHIAHTFSSMLEIANDAYTGKKNSQEITISFPSDFNVYSAETIDELIKISTEIQSNTWNAYYQKILATSSSNMPGFIKDKVFDEIDQNAEEIETNQTEIIDRNDFTIDSEAFQRQSEETISNTG
jgi:hypothetical protein